MYKNDKINIDKDEMTLTSLQDMSSQPLQVDVLDADETTRVLSLTEEKEIKETLSNWRKNVALNVDSKKLQVAQMAINNIENLMGMLSDQDMLSRVRANTKDAIQYKQLTDAVKEQVKILNGLTRLDSLDGFGTSGRISVGLQLQSNDGTTTQVIINQE